MQTHKTYLPSFGLVGEQYPLCVLTVLAPGASGRDYSAYRGIVQQPVSDEDVQKVRKQGNKITRVEAELLFTTDLEWRK